MAAHHERGLRSAAIEAVDRLQRGTTTGSDRSPVFPTAPGLRTVGRATAAKYRVASPVTEGRDASVRPRDPGRILVAGTAISHPRSRRSTRPAERDIGIWPISRCARVRVRDQDLLPSPGCVRNAVGIVRPRAVAASLILWPERVVSQIKPTRRRAVHGAKGCHPHSATSGDSCPQYWNSRGPSTRIPADFLGMDGHLETLPGSFAPAPPQIDADPEEQRGQRLTV